MIEHRELTEIVGRTLLANENLNLRLRPAATAGAGLARTLIHLAADHDGGETAYSADKAQVKKMARDLSDVFSLVAEIL